MLPTENGCVSSLIVIVPDVSIMQPKVRLVTVTQSWQELLCMLHLVPERHMTFYWEIHHLSAGRLCGWKFYLSLQEKIEKALVAHLWLFGWCFPKSTHSKHTHTHTYTTTATALFLFFSQALFTFWWIYYSFLSQLFFPLWLKGWHCIFFLRCCCDLKQLNRKPPYT